MIYTGANQRWTEFHSWMCVCKGMGIQSYVELGCGSASWVQKIGVEKIITVDVLPNGLLNTGIPHVQGDSHDPATLDRVLDILGGPPDIVFIDADHEANAVLQDFALWHPVAQVAVGFHDIKLPSVVPAWEVIARRYPSIEIVSRDVQSANAWQVGSNSNGDLACGAIGVIFK